MGAWRSPPSWRRLLSLSLLAVHLGACTTWRVQQPTPETVIRDRAPTTIRITRTDGSTVIVHRPMIEGDSVVGQLTGSESADTAAKRIAIPLSAIEAVAIRRLHVLKTAGVFVLINLAWCAAPKCLAIDPPG